jgi:hypothetical protein
MPYTHLMSDSANPYRPPHAAPTASDGSDDGASLYVMEQGLFVVDSEKKIPAVCLKCARTDDIERREQRFAIGTASTATGALGGILGASIANVVRNDRELLLPLVGVVLLVIVAVGAFVHLRSERVPLQLPLCGPCARAWERGVVLRTSLLAVFGAMAFGGLLAFYLEATDALIVLGGAFVVWIIAAIAMKLPARFVTARKKTGTRVYLFGVGPAVPDAVVRRRAERAAKRADRAKRDAAEAIDA